METVSKNAPALIAWKDGFKIGIVAVDSAHRQLFDGVASLRVGMDAQTLAMLQEEILRHFAHEQDLMERSGYPAVEQHVKLHQEFAAQLAGFGCQSLEVKHGAPPALADVRPETK